jgi:pimeloyl-ACP methyl ester carboxylesterase
MKAAMTTSASGDDGFDRVPIILQFAETTKFVESYGFVGTQGFVALEGQRFIPRAHPQSDTVYIFMHPTSTLQLLPMPAALANAGLHVICAGSRYPKTDSALIMEKVCFDLGQYVRWAREVCGYSKVVLVGWSGGGALSLFYQSQALHPSITHTAAGDSYDLTQAGLIPADGVAFIAAHLSRAETLTEFIDPSVLDESNPDIRDLELDIYDPACPNRPPFSADFVERFREAQRARNRRITTWAEQLLMHLREKDDGEVERGFVVHRTMCDVRWIDATVDPNGRAPNHCFLGVPRVANSAPAGLARFSTLRSWLSQWSYDRCQAKGPASAARIDRTPVLQIENGADDAVPATHNAAIFAALGTPDKEFVSIAGATHYYQGQPNQLKKCIDTLIDWSVRKELLFRPVGAVTS